jgi:hypothetical protein
MNEIKIPHVQNSPIVSMLSFALVLAISAGGFTGCKHSSTWTNSLTDKDVIGLPEAELRAKYPSVAELEGSFDLLVSKHLHPYHPATTNKLLRFGREYLVAELKNGKVIALHRVSG